MGIIFICKSVTMHCQNRDIIQTIDHGSIICQQSCGTNYPIYYYYIHLIMYVINNGKHCSPLTEISLHTKTEKINIRNIILSKIQYSIIQHI